MAEEMTQEEKQRNFVLEMLAETIGSLHQFTNEELAASCGSSVQGITGPIYADFVNDLWQPLAELAFRVGKWQAFASHEPVEIKSAIAATPGGVTATAPESGSAGGAK